MAARVGFTVSKNGLGWWVPSSTGRRHRQTRKKLQSTLKSERRSLRTKATTLSRSSTWTRSGFTGRKCLHDLHHERGSPCPWLKAENDSVTLLMCGNAAGHMLKPGLINMSANSGALKNKNKTALPVHWMHKRSSRSPKS